MQHFGNTLPLFRSRNGKAAKNGDKSGDLPAQKKFKAFEEKSFEAKANLHSFHSLCYFP
jgi:hypothetical protein